MHGPLLDVSDLTVQYHCSLVPAVRSVTFALAPGERLGIFGRSGSGKSTLARSLLRLGARDYRVTSGSIRFRTMEILGLRRSRLQRIRGREIALIGQEPELALNPVLTVGEQITEVLRAHVPGHLRVHHRRVRDMLTKVRLDDPAIFHAYPHQLSGGQRQRVVIAQALVCKPALLIADEPTSALDVRTRADILTLLETLTEELQLSLILISHQLEILRRSTDRVACMHEGRLAECVLPNLVTAPLRPSGDGPAKMPNQSLAEPQGGQAKPLIEVRRLFKSYSRGGYLSSGRYRVTALSGVDFQLLSGETIALVGESGSGKSTLARCLARLEDPDSGEIQFNGKDALNLPRAQLTSIRRRIQLVFQHSGTALNPFHSAEEIVGEPLRIHGELSKRQRREIVLNYLERVGLSPEWAARRPWHFSGGQRQRLGIARAMILNPDVVIFDEALAGLDLATRRDILDLLLQLQTAGPKSYLFITHDLQMAEELTKSILIMQNGKITESSIFSQPSFPRIATGQTAFTPHA